jgi:hypothetical protein
MAVAERAGAGRMLQGGSTLFHVELPTGQTIRSLVPAVGGGYRGMVRAAGSTKIAGQARLVPVSGAAAGAGLALGPLIGLMALSVGAEMIAGRQQEKVLEAIRRSVAGIERHMQRELTAKLTTAEAALEAAHAAVLDQVTVPQSVGLSSAVTGLHDVKNLAVGWLQEWETRLAALERDAEGVDLDDVKTALDVGLGGHEAFPAHVMLLYRALVLDSWSHVLTASESALANPGQTMDHLQTVLQRKLDDNSAVFDRVRQMLLTIKESPVTVGTLSWFGTTTEAYRLDATLGRLTHAIIDVPALPAVLTDSNRQVLEAVRESDGTVTVLRPREAAV